VIDTVATVLEQESRATIDDWIRRLDEEHLTTGQIDSAARSSHLPELFLELVHRLRNPIAVGAKMPSSRAAAEHGRLRRKQGYSSATLIEESRCLQVSIFHTLNLNAHRIDFNQLLPDVMVIADEVDSQLLQAMASYSFDPASAPELSLASEQT